MNNPRHRPPASRIETKGIVSRQAHQNTIASGRNEKEGIVQKLQSVLFAVRRDRDREHRSCDIAMERLRSAKDAFEAEKSAFEAEKKKLTQTQDESEKTQKEILRIETTLHDLRQKVRKAMCMIQDSQNETNTQSVSTPSMLLLTFAFCSFVGCIFDFFDALLG